MGPILWDTVKTPPDLDRGQSRRWTASWHLVRSPPKGGQEADTHIPTTTPTSLTGVQQAATAELGAETVEETSAIRVTSKCDGRQANSSSAAKKGVGCGRSFRSASRTFATRASILPLGPEGRPEPYNFAPPSTTNHAKPRSSKERQASPAQAAPNVKRRQRSTSLYAA